RTLRRTVQVRLRFNTLWLPGGTPIFTVSRRQFMKHPGYKTFENKGVEISLMFKGHRKPCLQKSQ
ncbi:MAG: hypothetical protein PVF48_13480, partial [Syntrophobacterales bacterium]